jgi:hypothetical protein
MRDINDDLRRNPYNQETRSVAEPFARLLKQIVQTIDRYGLRCWHLHKYVNPAEKLCKAIAERHFTSSCASKYQSRFAKYGSRLFTFLKYDGVPWNNNNAEHAVHRFAKLRRIADGIFTRSSVQELLVLFVCFGDMRVPEDELPKIFSVRAASILQVGGFTKRGLK